MLLKTRHLPKYTLKDYERWEGNWELVEGIPYALASPSLTHQRILGFLFMFLQPQIEEQEECKDCIVTIDTDYIISENTVFRPDLAVVCSNKDEKITKTPILIVEVVSPASRKMDEEIKPIYYSKEGVKYYLLIYPDRKEAVFKTLEDGKYKTEPVKGRLKIETPEGCNLEIDLNGVWKRI